MIYVHINMLVVNSNMRCNYMEGMRYILYVCLKNHRSAGYY